MSMNNYRQDGWQKRDWHEVGEYCKDLQRCAADLQTGVDDGGDKFTPDDVVALAARLEIIAKRLRDHSRDY